MCGIAGILTSEPYDGGELSGWARRMSDPIVHRGPDDGGVWA